MNGPRSVTEQAVAEGAIDIAAAVEFSGLGRTTLYGLMESGDLVYIKIGKRRLIPRTELRRLLSSGLVDRRVPEVRATGERP